MYPSVRFSTVTIAETWRQLGCSSAGEGPREAQHRRTAGAAQPERENAACSRASDGQTPCGVTHMWSLNCGTDEPVCEIETASGIENRCVVPQGKGLGAGGLGVCG